MKRLHWINYFKTLLNGKYRPEIRRYLLLLLIPVIVLALLYVNVNQVVTQQTKDYAELVIDNFYVQSSSMLHEIQLVSTALLRDQEIAWVLRQEDPTALNSLHVSDIIADCLEESPYVQHAYLICEKSGKIYSEKGLFSGESLDAILARIGTTASTLDPDSSETSFHILNESRMAPYCIIPIYDDGGSFQGYLIITLHMTEFLRIFYAMDADLCAIFNEDVYVSSYIKNIKVENFDWRDENCISALVGEPVVCVYRDEADYTYLVAVSRANYNRPLKVIVIWFFIYAAAALVAGYLYLYHVSKKRYQRISAMIEALPLSYMGDQSYEHIYENIRKSLEDYRTQRENLQIENQEHILHMLLETSGDRETTAEQFQKAGIDPNYQFYYVATFFAAEIFDDLVQEKGRTHGTAGFLHMLLRTTVNELANQYQIPCAFCGIPKTGIAVLFGNDAALLKDTVLKLSGNVVEILTSSYTMNIQATISSPVTSVLGLPEAYQETQRLRSFAKSINSNAATISQEELQRSSGVLLNGDFLRQEQILLNTILVRKYDVVPSMVESILSTHVSPLRKNYTLAQRRLQSITNILTEGVRMACVSDSAIESAKAIGHADSVRQLVAATNQVYGQLAEQSREATSESDIIALACDYIDRNLSDPNLNVAIICEAAGVSVQRLTRMFQSQFNMAIAEYMNACRIKRAKELLPDKQLTVAQIAAQVGYSNADTFTRNFKKIEGITATEYRKTLCGD